MNKKILVVACLVMMTTVFSGCDLLGGDKNESMMDLAKNAPSEVNDKDNKDNGEGNYFETMTDLMKREKPMKCVYTQEIDGGETANGVVYMSDGNARTEITLSTGKMYAIIDQEYTYSWIEGSSKGYKMTLEAAEMDAKMKNKVSNLSKEIDFKCNSWKKDSSKFKAPSNVAFQDMSAMMEGFDSEAAIKDIENAEANADKMICDMCKMVPVSEQAECLGDVVCDWQ
ncbi:MAG: hypothetical protein U9N04_01350 [Patescibacteria group bacterium]|nr:hypothetical protein [Patescibacteria group bacterium]